VTDGNDAEAEVLDCTTLEVAPPAAGADAVDVLECSLLKRIPVARAVIATSVKTGPGTFTESASPVAGELLDRPALRYYDAAPGLDAPDPKIRPVLPVVLDDRVRRRPDKAADPRARGRFSSSARPRARRGR
jgi:hypothetical protein